MCWTLSTASILEWPSSGHATDSDGTMNRCGIAEFSDGNVSIDVDGSIMVDGQLCDKSDLRSYLSKLIEEIVADYDEDNWTADEDYVEDNDGDGEDGDGNDGDGEDNECGWIILEKLDEGGFNVCGHYNKHTVGDYLKHNLKNADGEIMFYKTRFGMLDRCNMDNPQVLMVPPHIASRQQVRLRSRGESVDDQRRLFLYQKYSDDQDESKQFTCRN